MYQGLFDGTGALKSNDSYFGPELKFHPSPVDYNPAETTETPNLRLTYDLSGADRKTIDYARHNEGLYTSKAAGDYASNAYGDRAAGQEASRNPYGLPKSNENDYDKSEDKQVQKDLSGGLADIIQGMTLPSVD